MTNLFEGKVNTIVNYIMAGYVNGQTVEDMIKKAYEKAFDADNKQYAAAERKVKSIIKDSRKMEQYKTVYGA